MNDTVIVGAGLAGLTAAFQLRGSARILEARDRIGGRTWGDYWAAANRSIDMGGTWLLPGFSETFDLLDQFDIDTEDSPSTGSFFTHMSNGIRQQRSGPHAELAALNEHLMTLSGSAASAVSTLPTHIADWHRATQRYLAGAPLETIDVGHLALDVDDLANPDHYATKIVGTTQTLVNALATDLQIEMNTPVTRIDATREGYEVHTAHETIKAQHVVLAVPRNVLHKITFDDGFLGQLGRPHPGASRKEWFILDGVTDHFRVFGSDSAFGYFRTETRLDDGGMLAVGFTPEHEPQHEIDLDQYVPGATVRARLTHDWVRDPWAEGTWFVPRPGDYEALTQLTSGLHLVGGDFCQDFPGTIEGAIRTGKRAALEIMESQ